jgi:MFS family permease
VTEPGAPGPAGAGPPDEGSPGRSRGQRAAPVTAIGRAVRRGTGTARSRVVVTVGGPARARVIILLACVLALASADTATVGASAVELRRALGIGNTGIGLLVTVTSVVGVVFSLPFGVLADRARRTWILSFALVTWGGAMLWSATAGSFGQLLLARLGLGAVTAAAGPVVASLVGDWFPAAERGRIYGYVLTGELLGAGAGFAGTGVIAALSWRAAFVILALPAFVLAVLIFRLPEPARGGKDALAPDPGIQAARPMPAQDSAAAKDPPSPHALAAAQGVRPNLALARQAKRRMTFIEAVRYVLAVKTNVALIISSACGYYFLAGVQTFGAEFTGGQYHINQIGANLLLLVVGVAAVGGVLGAGPLSDALLRRGHLTARITVAAGAATVAVALFIPALVTHSALTALPYVMFAAVALAAQNPPIDAARQDIMPPWLWGRAEAIRTSLRTAAQALAPLLFGAASEYVFGGGTSGLKWTFVVMLLPLAASAVYLYRARRLYPTDVATTTAITTRATRSRPAQPTQPRTPPTES